MKKFEIFNEVKKKGQNGRRKFRAILYQIYPDDCIDEENEVGTQYNLNGITWIRQYCEKELESIKGMSLRCEFTDEERTEICGHGMTDIIDDIPIFEDAVMIGKFTNGYIDEIEDENGEKITVCIGEGEIDSSCYHNFCEKLDEYIADGYYPSGSVEIMRKPENDGIVYKYGYKDEGRIPTEFIHSGYALLGITPSDDKAKLIELNNKEEKQKMNENDIKSIVEQTITAMSNHTAEINACKDDYEKKLDELNKAVETVTSEKNEVQSKVDAVQAALDACQKERNDAWKRIDELGDTINALRKQLADLNAEKKIAEFEKAMADYTEDEQSYAQAEIESFKKDPTSAELNSIVDKILIGIGQKAKKEAKVVETNELRDIEDIFSGVKATAPTEDTNIF